MNKSVLIIITLTGAASFGTKAMDEKIQTLFEEYAESEENLKQTMLTIGDEINNCDVLEFDVLEFEKRVDETGEYKDNKECRKKLFEAIEEASKKEADDSNLVSINFFDNPKKEEEEEGEYEERPLDRNVLEGLLLSFHENDEEKTKEENS